MSSPESAISLTVLGVSPSFPNPGGASSGYLIEYEDTRLLVDCGHGIAGVLPTVTDPASVTAIVISHMHPDHYLDLVPLNYAYRFRYELERPIPLFVPPGASGILEKLWEPLHLNRFEDAFEVVEYNPSHELVLDGLTLTFAPGRHYIDGYAMRISPNDGEHELGYSGDTGYAETVIELLRDASLALVEASFLTYDQPGLDGHLTAELAGRMGREAKVRRLLLTHYPDFLGQQLAASASGSYGATAELAEPLRTYRV